MLLSKHKKKTCMESVKRCVDALTDMDDIRNRKHAMLHLWNDSNHKSGGSANGGIALHTVLIEFACAAIVMLQL